MRGLDPQVGLRAWLCFTVSETASKEKEKGERRGRTHPNGHPRPGPQNPLSSSISLHRLLTCAQGLPIPCVAGPPPLSECIPHALSSISGHSWMTAKGKGLCPGVSRRATEIQEQRALPAPRTPQEKLPNPTILRMSEAGESRVPPQHPPPHPQAGSFFVQEMVTNRSSASPAGPRSRRGWEGGTCGRDRKQALGEAAESPVKQ